MQYRKVSKYTVKQFNSYSLTLYIKYTITHINSITLFTVNSSFLSAEIRYALDTSPYFTEVDAMCTGLTVVRLTFHVEARCSFDSRLTHVGRCCRVDLIASTAPVLCLPTPVHSSVIPFARKLLGRR